MGEIGVTGARNVHHGKVETLCQLYYWERFHGQPSAKHGLWSGVSGQSQQQTLPTLGVAGRLVQQ